MINEDQDDKPKVPVTWPHIVTEQWRVDVECKWRKEKRNCKTLGQKVERFYGVINQATLEERDRQRELKEGINPFDNENVRIQKMRNELVSCGSNRSMLDDWWGKNNKDKMMVGCKGLAGASKHLKQIGQSLIRKKMILELHQEVDKDIKTLEEAGLLIVYSQVKRLKNSHKELRIERMCQNCWTNRKWNPSSTP